jgi:hypothetical protein
VTGRAEHHAPHLAPKPSSSRSSSAQTLDPLEFLDGVAENGFTIHGGRDEADEQQRDPIHHSALRRRSTPAVIPVNAL